MNESSVLYEFPITSRVRSFLRFEYLISKTERLIENAATPLESIQSLHQLVELLRHNDIKSELLRHIRRQEQELQKFTSSSPVDQKKLLQVVREKQATIRLLDEFRFPLANYTNNHFLDSVRLRLSVPGGTCNFDLPQMNAWLHLSDQVRKKDLENWFEPFLVLKSALQSTLSMTRMSADFSTNTAEKGYFSGKQSPKRPTGYSLIRITLEYHPGIYPKVSTGPQQFRIYFFEIGELQNRPSQIQKDIQFQLACCTL